jgi:hypothetical protein
MLPMQLEALARPFELTISLRVATVVELYRVPLRYTSRVKQLEKMERSIDTVDFGNMCLRLNLVILYNTRLTELSDWV